MAPKLKTTRYWTRSCPNCNFEYPNWFTVCPKCHQMWNSAGIEKEEPIEIGQEKDIIKKEKTIRIIAQITEDEVKIKALHIFFSADNGISWFQQQMIRENDYFISEIEKIPINSTVVYYLKGIDENNFEFIEDNEKEYYYYHVTEEIEEETPRPAQKPKMPNKTKIPEIPKIPEYTPLEKENEKPKIFQEPKKPIQKSEPPKTIFETENSESGVIFTPLNQVKKK